MQIFFFDFVVVVVFFIAYPCLLYWIFFSEETVNETPWLFGERGSKHRRTIKQIDCKTVGFFFFFRKISKEIGKAWHKSLICARKRSYIFLASLPQSRSLFSASFQTFCLTARALNTQKYELFRSLSNKQREKEFFCYEFLREKSAFSVVII